MLSTRFGLRYSYYLIIATIASFLISLFILQVFTGMLVLLWLFESGKNKLKALDTISYLFIVYVIIRLLSVVFSEFPASSNPVYYKEALFYLSFFAFSYYLKAFDEKKIKIIHIVFVASAILVAVIGLTRFLSGSVERAQSFTAGYSTFSAYLTSSLGLTVVLLKSKGNKKSIYIWLAGLILMLVGIVTSLGRTNIVIAAVIVVVGVISIRVKIKYIVTALLIVFGVSYVFFQINSDEISRRIEAPAYLSDRDILLNSAKEIFLKFENPILGYGPRTFSDIFDKRDMLADKGVRSWHNEFIQTYFESGILGLLTLLIIILFPLVKAIRCLRKCKLPDHRQLFLIGIILGEIALVLTAITSGLVHSPVLSVLFAFFIAVIASYVYPSEEAKKDQIPVQ